MFGAYGFGQGYFGEGPDGTGTPEMPHLGPVDIVPVVASIRRTVRADAHFTRTVNAEATIRRSVKTSVER